MKAKQDSRKKKREGKKILNRREILSTISQSQKNSAGPLLNKSVSSRQVQDDRVILVKDGTRRYREMETFKAFISVFVGLLLAGQVVCFAADPVPLTDIGFFMELTRMQAAVASGKDKAESLAKPVQITDNLKNGSSNKEEMTFGAGGSITTITNSNIDREIFQSKIPVIVLVWKKSCSKCPQMKALFKKVAPDYAGRVKFATCDVGTYLDAGIKMALANLVPMTGFFKEGKRLAIGGVCGEAKLRKDADTIITYKVKK
ncbi:thioredoxin family protein [Elusimicrobiota bacterium]